MAEMTCPTCGKQYYGIGCPYCDFPPVAPDSGLARKRFLFGLVFIAIGLSIVAMFIFDPSAHQPEVLVAGCVFGLGGIHMVSLQHLYDENGRALALVGGALLVLFSYLCFFGTFSHRAHWSLLPFLPPAWSHMFARIISGLFGVLLAAFSLRSFYLVFKPKEKR